MIDASLWPAAPDRVNAAAARFLSIAKANGVSVRLGEGDAVSYPNPEAHPCSGYFIDRPSPVLAAAVGGDWEEAFPVLVHEYAHFTQWAEKSPLWDQLFQEGIEAADWFDRWLEGVEIGAARLYWACAAIRAIEMDCEHRSLALIQKYQLPIDPVEYAQKANAYVHFYTFAQERRAWRPSDVLPPYRMDAIWRAAPTTLTDPEMPPPQLMAAYAKAYHM